MTSTVPTSTSGTRATAHCIAAAAVVALTLAGCGGSDETGALKGQPVQVASSLEKVAYALSPASGLVGQAMLREGWRFVPISADEVEGKPLVYIDSAAAGAMGAEVIRALSGRKGALLIDSRDATYGNKMLESEDGKLAQYASVFESGEGGLVPAESLRDPIDDNSPISRMQFALGWGAAAGTAVLVGPDSLTPIHVLADGRINGMEAVEGLSLTDPRRTVESWAGVDTTQRPAGMKTASDSTWAGDGWRYPAVDIVGVDRDVGFGARAKLLTESGCFASGPCTGKNRGFVASVAMARSGNDLLVGGVKAQIKALENPRYLNYDEGLYWYGPFATRYITAIQVANPTGNFRPVELGPSSIVDPDQTEETYSTGWSLGAGFSIPGYPFSISGAGTYAVLHKKITNHWTSATYWDSKGENPSSATELRRKPVSWKTHRHDRYGEPADVANAIAENAPASSRTGAIFSHFSVWEATGGFRQNGGIYVYGKIGIGAEKVGFKKSDDRGRCDDAGCEWGYKYTFERSKAIPMKAVFWGRATVYPGKMHRASN